MIDCEVPNIICSVIFELQVGSLLFSLHLLLPVKILSFSPEMVDVKAPSTLNLILHFL